ncbi:uncharacterized protein LOC122505846 [Leptopilina heterotoma]|uniref:uncharacterized protein LOC122505846 n=1 Tax=Leptopilina heterotoma TaxID=63436 RepID=UPI001CA80DAC|nr:uncharacterized protein LOC122505846 [Leptopilina heterotoma]
MKDFVINSENHLLNAQLVKNAEIQEEVKRKSGSSHQKIISREPIPYEPSSLKMICKKQTIFQHLLTKSAEQQEKLVKNYFYHLHLTNQLLLAHHLLLVHHLLRAPQ